MIQEKNIDNYLFHRIVEKLKRIITCSTFQHTSVL